MERRNPSPIKPRQLWSLRVTDQAGLHFQGRARHPHGLIFPTNVQVVCLDCETKPVFAEY